MLVPLCILIEWFFYLLTYLYLMRNILAIAASIFFISCSYDNKKLKEKLIVADSAAINYFQGNGSMDTVIAVRIIRDKKSIDQLSNFISSDIIKEKSGCGVDGSIHFFKNDVVMQDIYFRISDEDCNQFTFSFEKENGAARLSADAKKLLLQLKQ
jgi:hypothetical protein